MQTSRPTRPVTAIRPQPVAPQPQWQGLFLEPDFSDDLPEEPADDDASPDEEVPLEAA